MKKIIKKNNLKISKIFLDDILPNSLIKLLNFSSVNDSSCFCSCSFQEIQDLKLISQVWRLASETKKSIVFFRTPRILSGAYEINSIEFTDDKVIITCYIKNGQTMSNKAKNKAAKKIALSLKLDDVSEVRWMGEYRE